MTQKRKKVKKNENQQNVNPLDQAGKGDSDRRRDSKTDVQITKDTNPLLKQLISNLQELHGWEGTILQKLNKIIDTLD